ncbi:phosphomevalonate kinase [Gonapodya sp. JEL0774]|nr:phosphomevalonate kinase [Gonapodya sp. JEL0774]
MSPFILLSPTFLFEPPTFHQSVVTAPGKVLVVGGYLVLSPEHSGLVLSTTSRFYAVARTCRPPAPRVPAGPGAAARRAAAAAAAALGLGTPEVPTVLSHDAPRTITIMSPQFEDGLWRYTVKRTVNGLWSLESALDFQTPNKFVELALRLALPVAERYGGDRFNPGLDTGLEVTIVGHNDFYSQRGQLLQRGLSLTSDSLRRLPPFHETNSTIPHVAKTGLGSSAAMITSLVAALLSHLGAVDLPTNDPQASSPLPTATKKSSSTAPTSLSTSPPPLSGPSALALVHNLAQIVHCAAQGKVGSGFDVSAAVYGGQEYTRFHPNGVEEVLAASDAGTVTADTLVATVDPVLSKKIWSSTVIPFRLPPHTYLVLADIAGGSNTPSLVSRVQAWRRADPETSKKIWNDLDVHNMNVIKGWRELVGLSTRDPKGYGEAVELLEGKRGEEWTTLASTRNPPNPSLTAFATLRTTHLEIRSILRRVSALADVPIEPPQQTRLLDATAAAPGVVMCGVPGAGGFDAVFAITVGKREEVEMVWRGWRDVGQDEGENGNAIGNVSAKGTGKGSISAESRQASSGIVPIVCPLLAEEGSVGVRREDERGKNGINSMFF